MEAHLRVLLSAVKTSELPGVCSLELFLFPHTSADTLLHEANRRRGTFLCFFFRSLLALKKFFRNHCWTWHHRLKFKISKMIIGHGCGSFLLFIWDDFLQIFKLWNLCFKVLFYLFHMDTVFREATPLPWFACADASHLDKRSQIKCSPGSFHVNICLA